MPVCPINTLLYTEGEQSFGESSSVHLVSHLGCRRRAQRSTGARLLAEAGLHRTASRCPDGFPAPAPGAPDGLHAVQIYSETARGQLLWRPRSDSWLTTLRGSVCAVYALSASLPDNQKSDCV